MFYFLRADDGDRRVYGADWKIRQRRGPSFDPGRISRRGDPECQQFQGYRGRQEIEDMDHSINAWQSQRTPSIRVDGVGRVRFHQSFILFQSRSPLGAPHLFDAPDGDRLDLCRLRI